MKYERLTKEQLEEMHREFAIFLAAQNIVAEDWEQMKEQDPEKAEAHIDSFSDMVWERVLDNVDYLENIGEQHMHLFYLTENEMKLIAVRVNNPEIDLRSELGFSWFRKNWQSDFVDYMTAAKKYSEDAPTDKFNLIREGAVITKGDLYRWFDDMIG